MKKTYIYGLFSKNNPKIIKYIGKADNPEYRLKRHIHNTKYSSKSNKKLTHKDYWLIKENFEIGYIILEECDYNIWQEREKYYLSKFENLTNTSEGGKGGSGLIYTLPFDDVKNWVKSNLNIKSKSEWYKNNKNLPNFIPSNPREVYLKRGWISWGDFLGTNRIWDNLVSYLSYNGAKEVIKNLNIQTCKEYNFFAKQGKIPNNVPNRPDRYYQKRGWVSWGDFLGTGRVANKLKKKGQIN